MRQAKKNTAQLEASNKKDESLKCNKCENMAKDKKSVKDHCSNKHGRTCQKCNICNSAFQTEDMLQALIRVKHKNLDCNECDLTTFSKDILESSEKQA